MPKKPTQAKNPKVKPKSENAFNDKDMLLDALVSTKNLLNLYHTFKTETSNKDLYTKIVSLENDASQLQREIYDMMFEFGWYVLEAEPQTKIQKKVTQFTKMKKQLKK